MLDMMVLWIEMDHSRWAYTMAKTNDQKPADLLVDAKYEGKYVAFDPSAGSEIIAAGRNAGAVVARARKLGVQIPAIIFVPRGDEPLIY
jgi:hypothetical protein